MIFSPEVENYAVIYLQEMPGLTNPATLGTHHASEQSRL